MKDSVKHYVVAVLVVLGMLGVYKAYQSYQHFEWLNTTIGPDKDHAYPIAIPSWRK